MKTSIKIVSVLQMAVASLFLFLSVLSFRPERIWFPVLLALWLVIAIGLWQQRKWAVLLDGILLVPISALLLFQTYRRIAGLFTGLWKDCPPAYFLGFVTEQVILIPALVSLGVLFVCGRRYWNPAPK